MIVCIFEHGQWRWALNDRLAAVARLNLWAGVDITITGLTIENTGGDGIQVRKTPSWPRSWANFSLL
jgi:hypothetical protein